MTEQSGETSTEIDNNMSREEFDELVANEPSRTKQALARVYEKHFSRGACKREILLPELSDKDAINLTLSRLDTLGSDENATAIVAQIWKQHLEASDTIEKAA